MRSEAVKVFDDYLVANDSVTDYTPLDYTHVLSEGNPLALQAVVELHTTHVTSSATLTVAMQHSANGRDWEQKNATAEIVTPTPFAAPGTYTLTGGESTPTYASHGLVRLSITLNGGTQVHAGRVIIHAVSRARVRQHRELVAARPLGDDVRRQLSPAAVREMEGIRARAPHPETIAEARRLASEVAHLPKEEQLDHLKFYLSGRARRELVAFAQDAVRMTGHTRESVRQHAQREVLRRALRGSE